MQFYQVIVLFTIVLAAISTAQDVKTTTIGSTVTDIQANTDTIIIYSDVGIYIVMNPTVTANLSITYYAGADLPTPPNGYTLGAFTGGAGYNINVSPNTVVLSKFLFTSGPLSSTTVSLLSSTSSAVLLQYDGNLQFYSQATFDNSYNSTGNQVTANLVQSGSFFVATRSSTDNFAIPSFFTYKQFVPAHTNTTFIYPHNFAVANINSDLDNTLSVSEFGGNPNGVGNGNYVSLNTFWQIATTQSGANVNADLSYQFDQTEIDNGKINETSLEFWQYDGTKWVTEGNAQVDADNNYLVQPVTNIPSGSTYYGAWGLKNGEKASLSGSTTSDCSVTKPLLAIIALIAVVCV